MIVLSLDEMVEALLPELQYYVWEEFLATWETHLQVCVGVCVSEGVVHPKKYKDVVYDMVSEKNSVFSHSSLPVCGRGKGLQRQTASQLTSTVVFWPAWCNSQAEYSSWRS